LQRGSVLLDVRRRLGSFFCPRCSRCCRSPLSEDKGSFSQELCPSRVLRFLWPAFLSVGVSTSPGFWSLQRCLVLAPCEVGCPTPPRFRSQAFSTSQRFPGRLKVCGLVSCHYRSWDPPFRAFPSQGSRASLEALSRGRLLPCSYPPVRRRRAVLRRSPFGFTRRPRFRAVARVPPKTMDFLSTNRGLFPGRPGLRSAELVSSRQLHLLRSFHPPVRPFLRLRVAPRSSAVALLVFFPFEAFSSHTSDSQPAQPREAEHAPSSEDSGPLLRGPRPPESGELFPSTSTQKDLVDGFQPP